MEVQLAVDQLNYLLRCKQRQPHHLLSNGDKYCFCRLRIRLQYRQRPRRRRCRVIDQNRHVTINEILCATN